MSRRILNIILLSLMTNIISAQSLSSILSVAEESLKSKNYYDAFIKYKEALEFEPTNVVYLYMAAECGFYFGAYRQSAELFEQVLTSAENNKYPDASFKLGKVRQIQGDYQSAITAYKIYLSEHMADSSTLDSQAQKGILACQWALENIEQANTGIIINRLDNTINSSYSEFAPTSQGSQLYYSSLRFDNVHNLTLPKRHVASVLLTENLAPPERFLPDSFAGPNLSVAHSSFSPDRKSVYYTICEDLNDYDKRCDIYVSSLDSAQKWSKGIKLPEPVNLTGISTTQPHCTRHPTENYQILFFSSNRKTGSKGGFDIWYSIIDLNGNFSEPVNCSSFNSNEDDMSPFFDQKSQMLYFSSKGHLGFGGFDIYKSKLNDKGFGLPKNIGYPQNSSFDDLYFYLDPSDTVAYFSTNRTGTLFLDDATEACCLDIFKISLKPCDIKLNALVYNFYSKEELHGATIELIDLDNPLARSVLKYSELSNSFDFDIRCDKNYKIIARKEGFLPDSIQLNSGAPGEYSIITKKLFLKPSDLRLELLTFNKNTLTELPGVQIKIIDLTEPDLLDTSLVNPLHNSFVFKAVPCHKYKIVASKESFADVDTIITIDCGAYGLVSRKLYLPTILFSMLPVSLYFDNDRPDPNTLSTRSTVNYQKSYTSYFKKKEEFIKIYNQFSDASTQEDSSAMTNFFNNELKAGKEKFDRFLTVLETDLRNGKKYEIFVKGFASPLAKSGYNLNLSQRRIHSVYQSFHNYKKGVFMKYIQNGQLKLSQKPFGESTAPAGISDKKSDPRSVYTVEASRERRVEIVEIKE